MRCIVCGEPGARKRHPQIHLECRSGLDAKSVADYELSGIELERENFDQRLRDGFALLNADNEEERL